MNQLGIDIKINDEIQLFDVWQHKESYFFNLKYKSIRIKSCFVFERSHFVFLDSQPPLDETQLKQIQHKVISTLQRYTEDGIL